MRRGREDPNITLSGTSSADDGPTMNAGLVSLQFFRRSGPVLLRNPTFVIFQEGWTPYPPARLDPRMAFETT